MNITKENFYSNSNCLENGFSKEIIKELMVKRNTGTVKQVLVWRGDLKNAKGEKLRSGKMPAQLSHASLAVVLNEMRTKQKGFAFSIIRFMFWTLSKLGYKTLFFAYKENSPWDKWLNGRFTKVCVGCKDEKELLEIYQKAKDGNIPCVLITDAGLTEFGGVPTNTCVGIGPYWSEDIDSITGKLSLL